MTIRMMFEWNDANMHVDVTCKHGLAA
jgi:hypothetical protein